MIVGFQCPFCAAEVLAKKEDEGKSMTCPACGMEILVPENAREATEMPRPAPVATTAAPPPQAGTGDYLAKRRAKAEGTLRFAGAISAGLGGLIVLGTWYILATTVSDFAFIAWCPIVIGLLLAGSAVGVVRCSRTCLVAATTIAALGLVGEAALLLSALMRGLDMATLILLAETIVWAVALVMLLKSFAAMRALTAQPPATALGVVPE